MKIDLQKAYDSVEWAFVGDLLKTLGFPAQFIKLVINCVTSPSYSIALNGEVFGFFKGRRDDLIMFCKGEKGSVELMIHAYELFSRASSLVMNKGKSNIYFNGVSEGIMADIESLSGMKRGVIPFRYRRVIVSPKRLSVMDCNCLVEKVVERIRGLGSRKLSKFLWHGKETKESPALVAWDIICRPKKQGGLGLKNLQLWNTAAIGKYVWWIESKADHLWVKWVHAVDGHKWLQPALATVRWAPWVGIKLMLPKHKFFTWLVTQQRLLTQDRLVKMQIISDNQCYLCGLQEESHKHLFFECVYSSQCLCLISLWVGVHIPEQNVVQWWLSLRNRSLLKKQVIATVVCSLMYYIWECRNKCRIENSLIRPKVLCKRLKSQISDRLRCINVVSKCRATTVWLEGLQ
ncbi:uncharacterized protein LOC141595077 [Silene latifolia]|uniref:uncharacterized protein LOC141595077 n=1 Tax=Silene latifolia TaxID=37657 RepID=UPI003D77BAA7